MSSRGLQRRRRRLARAAGRDCAELATQGARYSASRAGCRSGKIKHIVIIVQENRSFNNLFYGFPGATTASTATTTNGNKIKLLPIALETSWDFEHDSYGVLRGLQRHGQHPGHELQDERLQ